jgi:zinc transport system substrate-binding protein
LKKLLVVVVFLLLFHPEAFAKAKFQVTVSIQPQVYFLEKIGGERVKINLLVPAGRNPATYAPTPLQIAKLVKSNLYFSIGMPFEKRLMPKIKNIARKTRIIKTQQGIQKRQLEIHHDTDSSHNDQNHSEEHPDKNHQFGYDPHIWLNPLLVKIQAESIKNALSEYDPAGASFYKKNFLHFLSELDQLHIKLKAILAPLQGESIYVFHPSYGYFTDAYGLKQKAIELEGKRPKAKELAQFIKNAKKESVQVIFVQPQFDRNTARKIAMSIKSKVVTLDPLAKNYLLNMESMARKIFSSLQ